VFSTGRPQATVIVTTSKASNSMSVKVNIHPFLSQHADDQDVVEVSGGTVGQCLEHLVGRFPDLSQWLFEKDGRLNRLVEIYVNAESSYPEELAKPVKDGDQLHILIIISGG
jgi:molybdopterin converting factor small subunit